MYYHFGEKIDPLFESFHEYISDHSPELRTGPHWDIIFFIICCGYLKEPSQ